MSETPAALGRNDFAFQTGVWRVHHRKLRRRLVGDTVWNTFEGRCRAWELFDGAGSVEDQIIEEPSGHYLGGAIRQCDLATGIWSTWWMDSRAPGLGEPVLGRFQDGIGRFTGKDTLDGRPIHVRFLWSEITSTSARWEQAFSPDAGANWETNWVMRFDRV